MFRLPLFIGASCVALCSPSVAAAATQPVPAASAEPQEIGSVSVTSDRHAEPIIRSARPTFVVTAEQIRARGAVTISDALKLVPGAVVLPYGGVGQTSSVLLPGSNKTNDVLVLINGFPIQNAYSGAVDLGTIMTAGVSRIEVIQGGAASLYGTSAVAGVLNIITGNEDRPYAAITSGSFGSNRFVASDSVHVGGGTVQAAFGRQTSGNAYPYAASSTYGSSSAFPAGTRANAFGQLTTGMLTYSDDPNKAWRIGGIVNVYGAKNGVPNSLPTTNFASSQASSTHLVGMSLEHNTERAKTTLAISDSRNTLQFIDPVNLTSVSTANVNRSDISLRTLIGKGPSRVLLGAETSRQSVGAGSVDTAGLSNSDVGARQSQSALYAQYEHDIASTGRAYAGLRYERDSPQGHTVAPAVGMTVPVGALRVGFNAGTAFRVPSLVELYFPGFGNSSLQPERSRYADFTISAPQIGGGVSLRAFSRRSTNLIQSLPVVPFTPSNIAKASFQGFVLSGATKPYRNLILRASYTDTYKADDVTNGVPTRLLNAPQTITSFSLERLPSGNSVSYGVIGNIYSSSLQFNGPSTPWTALDAYVRMPVSPVALLTFRSKNATNESYEANTGYPMPRRSYEVELSTR